MPPPASAWIRIGELSRRTGVSPDLLRVWERRYGLIRPRRTDGNLRLYSALDEARIRVMTRHLAAAVPAAQAAEMALTASFSISPGPRDPIPQATSEWALEALMQSMEAFDEASADQLLQQLLVDYTQTVLLRDVILPFMHRVGDRWETGTISVAHEHFATHFIQSRLLALARGWDRGLGPRAVLACAPSDQHTLGLIAFGIAMHKLGWRITYLGAQTPTEAVLHVAAQVQPALVVVCGALASAFSPNRAALAELATLYDLAIAGRAATPELAEACGARHLDGDPVAMATATTCASRRP